MRSNECLCGLARTAYSIALPLLPKRTLFLSEPAPNLRGFTPCSTTSNRASQCSKHPASSKILTASLRMRKTARLFRQFHSTAARCVLSGHSVVVAQPQRGLVAEFFHRRSHPRFYVRNFRTNPMRTLTSSASGSASARCVPRYCPALQTLVGLSTKLSSSFNL